MLIWLGKVYLVSVLYREPMWLKYIERLERLNDIRFQCSTVSRCG